MEIEEGVPIPPARGGIANHRGSKEPRSMGGVIGRKIQVGQSVFCDQHARLQTIRKVVHELGGKCATRKVRGGWRLWRIE